MKRSFISDLPYFGTKWKFIEQLSRLLGKMQLSQQKLGHYVRLIMQDLELPSVLYHGKRP